MIRLSHYQYYYTSLHVNATTGIHDVMHISSCASSIIALCIILCMWCIHLFRRKLPGVILYFPTSHFDIHCVSLFVPGTPASFQFNTDGMGIELHNWSIELILSWHLSWVWFSNMSSFVCVVLGLQCYWNYIVGMC